MELFHIGFIKFGIVDLIDVLLVSYIFYRLLLLMKGTRSAQIVNPYEAFSTLQPE